MVTNHDTQVPLNLYRGDVVLYGAISRDDQSLTYRDLVEGGIPSPI